MIKWLNELYYIHTVEYFGNNKKQTSNKWNDLDESPANYADWKRQSQKVIHCTVSFIKHSWHDKIIKENLFMIIRH